jgi:putative hemolysin
MRNLALVFLLLFPAVGLSQGLEPGEWEFNAVTTSPLLPGGQTSVFRRCIKQEDAENPERWMARQSATGPCKLTPGEKTEDSMLWTVECPKTNMRGHGVARLTGRGTVVSDLWMTGELQGYRVETYTKTSGKRLGPCKSPESGKN